MLHLCDEARGDLAHDAVGQVRADHPVALQASCRGGHQPDSDDAVAEKLWVIVGEGHDRHPAHRVTDQHHRELGPVQAANPDVVIWPSREVITYFGHATVFGETPNEVDWRHGFDDVTLAQFCSPALTSVHIPREQIGRTICDCLLPRDQAVTERDFVIDPELVLRESTAAPPVPGPARSRTDRGRRRR